MKLIEKSFKVLWHNKSSEKLYIDVFNKDGTFIKHDLNGKIFAKGTFKLYNLNDRSFKNFITFTIMNCEKTHFFSVQKFFN